MTGYVNGIDWINAESMRYWSFPSSTPIDKRRAETHNMVFSNSYLGALKVDGYYERLIKDEDGNCFMVARSKNVKGAATEKLAWVPQIHDFMESLPNGTVLLSECWLPGNEGSKKITSLLGCLKEKCIARQENGQKLHFYIFDVMAWAGSDFTSVPFGQRVDFLNDVSYGYFNKYIEWAHYFEGEELWHHLQMYLAEGREGMVIMRKDAPVYFKRTPAHVSLKIKKELQETLDCYLTGRATAPTKAYTGKNPENWTYWVNIVTNERLPEGEYYYDLNFNNKPIIPVTKPYYYGWAGSLEIAVLDGDKEVSLGYVSGLPDEVKMNYKDYIHSVVEIGGMEFDPETNRLRHGKVLRFKTPEEKTWRECTYDQIKEL